MGLSPWRRGRKGGDDEEEDDEEEEEGEDEDEELCWHRDHSQVHAK